MLRNLLLAGSALVALAEAPLLAQSNPLAVDAAAFGSRDAATHMDISPDGRHVVFIGPGPGRMSVVFVADLTTGQTKPILKSDGNPDSLSWCAFATNDRLACRYTGSVNEMGQIIGYSRLASLNLDGSNIVELGERGSAYDARIRQFDGSIVDWLPGDNDSVLMSREFIPETGKTESRLVRKGDGLGVVKVNVRTLKADIIERPNKAASFYMSDGLGTVRLMAIPERTTDQQLTGRTKYQYRAAGSRDWQLLQDYQSDDFVPLAIDGSIDSLYALKKLDGRLALYRIKLASGLHSELIASHPRVDIDDVIRLGDGQKVVGYSFIDDRRQTVYFDPELKKLVASLSKALPASPLIDFVTASRDGQSLLLFAGGDNDPGRYYLYEKAKRALGEVAPARPALAERTLALVKHVTYPAADGTQIPAYLTLPPNAAGKKLGAVVLPHGGPSARDEWGFDWLAQFIASRGYAVIQPNFRGSAGYGDAWLMDNGFKSWRTSIGDVTAAARWLASQGVADPGKIAIVGWSYGGYAALQAATTEPDLFKAVAAIAPVTDLNLLKTDFEGFTNERFMSRYIGSGAHIAEGSPLRNSASIKAPVLLIHGDMDGNVGVGHSRKMHNDLRGKGKQSDYLEFKGLDHQLRDTQARQQMLTKIGELLQRTIGN